MLIGADEQVGLGQVSSKERTNKYRRGTNSKKNIGKTEKLIPKGYAEDVKESYEDVVIKNKQQVFKPAKLKLEDDFEEVVYDDKRTSKEGFRVSNRDGEASDEESR